MRELVHDDGVDGELQGQAGVNPREIEAFFAGAFVVDDDGVGVGGGRTVDAVDFSGEMNGVAGGSGEGEDGKIFDFRFSIFDWRESEGDFDCHGTQFSDGGAGGAGLPGGWGGWGGWGGGGW